MIYPRNLDPCFNSKMVRLKDVFLKHNNVAYNRFNSKMVRLKVTATRTIPLQLQRFNSKMVRLKVSNTKKPIIAFAEFQFQNGSIKRLWLL